MFFEKSVKEMRGLLSIKKLSGSLSIIFPLLNLIIDNLKICKILKYDIVLLWGKYFEREDKNSWFIVLEFMMVKNSSSSKSSHCRRSKKNLRRYSSPTSVFFFLSLMRYYNVLKRVVGFVQNVVLS